MSSIDKYAQFISNQQKTLESDGKLISEREVLINRLMAEGYTLEQIEFMIREKTETPEDRIIDALIRAREKPLRRASNEMVDDPNFRPKTATGYEGGPPTRVRIDPGSGGVGRFVLGDGKYTGSYALPGSKTMSAPVGSPDSGDIDNIPKTPQSPKSAAKSPAQGARAAAKSPATPATPAQGARAAPAAKSAAKPAARPAAKQTDRWGGSGGVRERSGLSRREPVGGPNASAKAVQAYSAYMDKKSPADFRTTVFNR